MRLTIWMLAALLAAGPVTAQVLAGAAQSESQQAGEWQAVRQNATGLATYRP
jgi:hypothetical protein